MKKILAIDDHEDNLIVYEAIISTYFQNFETILAKSGKEGIEKAIAVKPDVILLDIIMPEMDGYEACKSLKSHATTMHIPIILITAVKTDSASRIKGLEIGADAFLAKPIDPGEFAAQIKVMLRIKEAEDQLRLEKEGLETVVKQRVAELFEKNRELQNEIDERKRAETALIQFEHIVSASTDMLALIGDNYKYLAVNKAYAAAFNLVSDDLIGNSPEIVFGEDFFKTVIRPNADRCLGGEEVNYQYWFDLPSLGKQYLDVNYFPYYNEDGMIVGFVVNGRNITKRKKQEIKLKHSYSFNESLLHTIPFRMDIVDASGTILFINPILNKLFGEDIKGKKCWDIYRHNKTQCEDCPLKKKIKLGETKAIESDGIIGGRTFEITHTGMMFKGEEAIMEVFYDITDRIRNEGIQRVVYNIANAVNSTFDLDDLNHSIKNLLGEVIDTSNFFIALYDRDTSIISVPYIVDEHDDFDTIPYENSLTGHVIRTEKPLFLQKQENQLQGIHEGPEYVGSDSLVWLGVPLKYQGEVIGAIVVQSYNDINAYSEVDLEILEYVSHQIAIAIQRKKTEGELINALEKAKESDRLKSAFLANVSHEIRTPLNSILGFSDLLSDPEVEDDEKKEYVKIINSGSNQLLSIIDDIVNISLIESGQLNIYLADVDLSKLFYTIYKKFAALHKSAKCKLKLNNCPEIIINSDEGKIEQVLTNFLTNAIKNTDEGEVSLGYEILEKTVLIKVQDTGKGIPSGYDEKLFERFFRIEDSSHLLSGTGLGLAISKAITIALKGDIWFESELGVGTTFFLSIPIDNGASVMSSSN